VARIRYGSLKKLDWRSCQYLLVTKNRFEDAKKNVKNLEINPPNDLGDDVGFAISLGIHVSVTESLRFPTKSELTSLNNISADLDSKEAAAVQSRDTVFYTFYPLMRPMMALQKCQAHM
jgi:hypothetical protein